MEDEHGNVPVSNAAGESSFGGAPADDEVATTRTTQVTTCNVAARASIRTARVSRVAGFPDRGRSSEAKVQVVTCAPTREAGPRASDSSVSAGRMRRAVSRERTGDEGRPVRAWPACTSHSPRRSRRGGEEGECRHDEPQRCSEDTDAEHVREDRRRQDGGADHVREPWRSCILELALADVRLHELEVHQARQQYRRPSVSPTTSWSASRARSHGQPATTATSASVRSRPG